MNPTPSRPEAIHVASPAHLWKAEVKILELYFGWRFDVYKEPEIDEETPALIGPMTSSGVQDVFFYQDWEERFADRYPALHVPPFFTSWDEASQLIAQVKQANPAWHWKAADQNGLVYFDWHWPGGLGIHRKGSTFAIAACLACLHAKQISVVPHWKLTKHCEVAFDERTAKDPTIAPTPTWPMGYYKVSSVVRPNDSHQGKVQLDNYRGEQPWIPIRSIVGVAEPF